MQLERDIVTALRAGKGESAIEDASMFEKKAIDVGTVPPGDHNKDFKDVGSEPATLDRDMDAEVEAAVGLSETWARREGVGAGEDGADREVENALLKSALGYTVTVRKPFKLKEVRNSSGEGRVEIERVEYAEEQIHVPGKITAQIYWLRRREPKPAAQGVDPLREVLRRWEEGDGEIEN